MLTAFGKVLRMLRLENNELLKDMSLKLDITPAYLSAIENGKKKPTQKILEKIQNSYILNQKTKENLISTFREVLKEITINIDSLDPDQQDLSLVFARKINDLNKENIIKIKEILSKK